MLIRSKKTNGFTLLELLIVVALSSLILMGVFQGFFAFKKIIGSYFQAIRLQSNIRLMAHELYQITDKAGQFGCAHSAQPIYIHWSKKTNFEHKKLLALTWFKKTDPLFKSILPYGIHARLKADSDILHTLSIEKDKKINPKNRHPVYADCQDVFILSNQDEASYFSSNMQFKYIGNLTRNLYFVAKSQRKNNQGLPIYSFYSYTTDLGVQEVLEGIESIHIDSGNARKINVLINSVEGDPLLKQWLTLVI